MLTGARMSDNKSTVVRDTGLIAVFDRCLSTFCSPHCQDITDDIADVPIFEREAAFGIKIEVKIFGSSWSLTALSV